MGRLRWALLPPTPGGHRRFHLEDISGFQTTRGFEATGFLTTEKWEEPEIEESLNRKQFDKVCQLIFYLATQNQRRRVKTYWSAFIFEAWGSLNSTDNVLLPVVQNSHQALATGNLTFGQERLVRTTSMKPCLSCFLNSSAAGKVERQGSVRRLMNSAGFT